MIRVLVIANDPIIREILAARLNRDGFQVLTATNGTQAIALARAELPDLIVLTMNLPIANEWQVVQRIKATPQTSRIPIIAIVDDLTTSTHDRCLAAGCDDCETRPIDMIQLGAKIRLLAGRSERGRMLQRIIAG
ncbi:MAG: response regulator [Chloroflexi bacterium]|nr:response regulator [Chloroflexota bacterium]